MKTEGLGVFGMSINGIPIQKNMNVFEQVQVQCGYGMSFPVMRLVVRDQHNLFVGDLALVDGTLVSVTFGKDTSEHDTYDFLVFSSNITHDAQPGSIFTLYAVLNVPGLIYGASLFKNDGTATDTLKKLFSDNNFDYEAVHDSSDSQLWFSSGESPIQFINKITTHAYSNESSCFTTAIDFHSGITIDVFKQLDKEAHLDIFYDAPVAAEKPFIVSTEVKPESRSSLLNSMSNYGHTHYQHTMGGELLLDSINPTVIDSLPINADIKKELEQAALTYGGGFDSGHGEGIVSNVHENYYQARYQNLRYLGLMSQGIKFTNRSYTNLPLFAVVNLNHGAVLGKAEQDTAIAGKYIITGKTLVLVNTQFLEVYEASRFFISETGNTKTVSSANATESIPTETDFESPGNSTPNQSNLTATGNKPRTKADTVLDKKNLKDTQQNPAVPQNLGDGEKSTFDILVDDLNGIVEQVENSFSEKGQAWGFPELNKKYGSEMDSFIALNREVVSALKKLDACAQLDKLESLSVNIAFDQADKLIQALADREGQLNSAIGQAESKLNAFLGSGEVDANTFSGPSATLNCKQRSEALNAASLKDKVTDACVKDRDVDKIDLPVSKLVRKLAQLVDDAQNILCALGK